MNSIDETKGRRVMLAGICCLALGGALLLCGAGPAPVENFAPQGAMQADLNAGGHSLTNAATVSAANVVVSGTLTPPSGFSLAFSQLTATPTTLAGYGITDPVVLTSGTYANPAWLTSLSYAKLTGAPALGSLAAVSPTGTASATTFLKYDGTAFSYATPASGANVAAGTGLTASGSGTVTLAVDPAQVFYTSGTVTVPGSRVTGTMTVGQGGTGATTALAAAQNLGVTFSNVIPESGSFTAGTPGALYLVTTGTNAITVTNPSAVSGGFFAVRKIDAGSGSVTVNGVKIGTPGHQVEVSCDGTSFYNKFLGGGVSGAGDYTFTAPSNNNYNIVTSGTGTFNYNGAPVLTVTSTLSANNITSGTLTISGTGLTALPANASLYPVLNQNSTGTATSANTLVLTGTNSILRGATFIPANSAFFILGDSLTGYPSYTENGTTGVFTGTATFPSWPQQLSGMPYMHNVPVYNYGVGYQQSRAGSRILAGTAYTSGSDHSNWFWGYTEFLNGSQVGTTGSGTSTPYTLYSSLGSGGVGFFVLGYTGVNDCINTITGGAQVSGSTFKTNLQGMCSTIHAYGSNVKVIGITPMQSSSSNQSLEADGGYGDGIRTLLGTGTSGFDAVAEPTYSFSDPSSLTWFADGLHLTQAGDYYYSQIVGATAIGVPYTPTLSRQTANNWYGPFNFTSSNISATPYNIGNIFQSSMPTGSLTYVEMGKSNNTGFATEWGFFNTGTSTSNYEVLGLINTGTLVSFNPRVYVSGHMTLGGIADDGVNMLNVNGGTQANAFNSNAAQTTISGSTSGTIVCSEPMAGSSFKMVAVHLSGLSGTATYSFPVAFSNAPHEADALGLATTLATGSATFTGSGTTADLMLIGY